MRRLCTWCAVLGPALVSSLGAQRPTAQVRVRVMSGAGNAERPVEDAIVWIGAMVRRRMTTKLPCCVWRSSGHWLSCSSCRELATHQTLFR
jgi:hypothetical protein